MVRGQDYESMVALRVKGSTMVGFLTTASPSFTHTQLSKYSYPHTPAPPTQLHKHSYPTHPPTHTPRKYSYPPPTHTQVRKYGYPPPPHTHTCAYTKALARMHARTHTTTTRIHVSKVVTLASARRVSHLQAHVECHTCKRT